MEGWVLAGRRDEEQAQGPGFWNKQRRSHKPGQGTVGGNSKTKGAIVPLH